MKYCYFFVTLSGQTLHHTNQQETIEMIGRWMQLFRYRGGQKRTLLVAVVEKSKSAY